MRSSFIQRFAMREGGVASSHLDDVLAVIIGKGFAARLTERFEYNGLKCACLFQHSRDAKACRTASDNADALQTTHAYWPTLTEAIPVAESKSWTRARVELQNSLQDTGLSGIFATVLGAIN